ncbi:DUF1565 domain-containing protein [Paenibacillus sp. R14(2021)]|uniref:DUF1565 domain-containing protein n=1 Tax=Paenibacillus sp. R14(2021) TaxID=2859228 RepID=UPI001C615F08|nr:DUF1565 domain-containing protein [Paenibacillus sp. R14(2021)]
MKRKLAILLVLVVCFGSWLNYPMNKVFAAGTIYYVSVDGNDLNRGTSLSAPFKTINKSVSVARAGDTIYVRGGTYYPIRAINPTSSGTSTMPITLKPYGNENVMVKGTKLLLDSDKVIRMDNVSYWIISKINVTEARGIGISIQNYAHHNRIESLSTYRNHGTGLHLENSAHDNYIDRVNSYLNYDEETGGTNADGFAIKNGAYNNTFNRCSAWNNSDDGWDTWEGSSSNINKSLAFNNGFDEHGKHFIYGNGNGFKLGGEYDSSNPYKSGNNQVRESIAFGNYASGFTYNGAVLPNKLYNTTAYNNNRGGLSYAYNYDFRGSDMIVNAISSKGRILIGANVTQMNNSWNLKIDPLFQSTDANSSNFLYLKEDSPSIDAGRLTGLPYVGYAPDLGAFEFGDEW